MKPDTNCRSGSRDLSGLMLLASTGIRPQDLQIRPSQLMRVRTIWALLIERTKFGSDWISGCGDTR